MKETTKEFWQDAYQSNIGKLVGLCYRYTHDYTLSEDLAHDAFLKAIDKIGTFEGKGKFEAWLRRIVVNHTLQYLRDRKKHAYVTGLSEDTGIADLSEDPINPISAMNFTTDELIATIGRLPEHHRIVFNLYVLDGFTHVQIGEELGISAGTSKSHLARARKKLQQLLTQQAAGEEREKEKKKALIFWSVIEADEKLDELFRSRFEKFSIQPRHPLSLDSIHFDTVRTVRSRSFIQSPVNIIVVSAIVTITLIVVLAVRKKQQPLPHQSLVAQTTQDSVKKKSADHAFPGATIPQDSVILKTNLKQQAMKPLDSLALMLVLSSSPLTAVTAKDSIKQDIEQHSRVDASQLTESFTSKPNVKPLNIPDHMKKGNGTFRASELYWSEENNELYFKGKVRVNFNKQRFHGDGSFTFLGRIHLLVVDGQAITPGSTVKLDDRDYRLVTLDSKAAGEKYGDQGMYGAVEISRAR